MREEDLLKRIKETKEGFNYIEVTPKECLDWGGLCICNSCGEPNIFENSYLVFVLGDLYCKKCFNVWSNRKKKLSQADIDYDLKLQKDCSLEFYKSHFKNYK